MINLQTLDPDTYKQNLISYLKGQTVFKDYDFEDSNINVLLDILSQNTYLNTFYKNMIFMESQLDSAQLRRNIISSAKSLNYTPSSKSSARALLKLTYTVDNISSLEIPKGTQFSGRSSLNTYTFTTNKSYIAKSSGNIFTFNDVEIFEGAYLYDTYVVNTNLKQDFIISNEDVDISSVEVLVINSDGSEEQYLKVDNTYGLNNLSKIFFIEGYGENQYKIEFGQDILGKQPSNSSTIIIAYRVAIAGDNGNSISTFNIDEDIVVNLGGDTLNFTIETIESSSGGADRESIESIRFNAPRANSTPHVATTANDYKALIIKKFNNIIDDVIVYGGEEITPKQYGKIILILKIKGTDVCPQYVKDMIYAYLSDKHVGSLELDIQNPDIFYIKIYSEIQFTSSQTSYSSEDLKSIVNSKITNWAENNLQKFGNDFRYSKFVNTIDQADASISSNDTSAIITKRIVPLLNSSSNKFFINFNNALNKTSKLKSSLFSWISESGILKNCFISDDGLGNLNIYQSAQTDILIQRNIGTINYDNGQVTISKLIVSEFIGDFISIDVKTNAKDIIAGPSMLLYLNPNPDLTIIEKIS